MNGDTLTQPGVPRPPLMIHDAPLPAHVHFVGIGGIGMSALARFLLAGGHRVSGSDLAPGEQGEALALAGAKIQTGHRAEHIDGAGLVVVTSAVSADNPEARAAQARGIPVMKRSELLAAIANSGRGIAVAGTHGKTTTSALIGHILTQTGLDPTVLVGGISQNLGSNARVGGGEFVVVEADEYDASFLHLHPEIAVITNVEPDHLDFYGDFDRLQAAFRQFAGQVTGTLIVCADDPVLSSLLPALTAGPSGPAVRAGISYGIDRGLWRATDIRNEGALVRFRVLPGGQEYRMQLVGSHMVRNALAAIVTARTVGATEGDIARALASFRGVVRRLETKGEAAGVVVIDDYAHLPTEIRVNLAALRQRYPSRPGGSLRVVFQPHTYSRTKTLLSEFAAAFRDADAVYLLDIYPSREPAALGLALGISGRDLADATKLHHPHVTYSETGEGVIADLLHDLRPGDVVITMGAGDVYGIVPRLLEGLRGR